MSERGEVPEFSTSAGGWTWLETPEGQAAWAAAIKELTRDYNQWIELFKVSEDDAVSRAWWDLQSE